MGQVRDSSLLFSLESLLRTEQERVHEEQRERERRVQEAERARRAEEERRRQAEQERLLAEEREREERERRQREEQARLAALREAEIERVRVEAQHASELELMARREVHERSMAELRRSDEKRRARVWSWVATAALIGGLAIPAGIYYFAVLPADARAQASARELAETERLIAEKSAEIERQKGAARPDSQRELEKLKQELDALKRNAASDKPSTKSPAPPKPKATATAPAKRVCKGNVWDPMNNDCPP